MDDDGHIEIAIGGEIDGVKVTPANVPTEMLAGLAFRYLFALRKVAAERDIDLGDITGMEIIPGSAVLQAKCEYEVEAAVAADAVDEEMRTPGANEKEHLHALALHASRLPRGALALVSIGTLPRRPIPSVAARRQYVTELTTRRMRIIGSKLEPEPKIFAHDLRTDRAVALDCDQATAMAARDLFGEDADLKLVLNRDEGTHKIHGGEVRRMTHAPKDWTVDGLLDWFSTTFKPKPT